MNPLEAIPPRDVLTLSDITSEERASVARFSTWPRFHYGPRRDPQPLLRALPQYARSVLVAGCQRSGTTILTRILANSPGFQRFKLTHDDELDAALILSGKVAAPRDRRYCFQTTYLNERLTDYGLMQPDQRLIWVVRNPYSVVYSMLYNWRRFALNELYEGCVESLLPAANRRSRLRLSLPWPFGPSQSYKACAAYAAKTSQIHTIRQMLEEKRVLIVEYDSMIRAPHDWLSRIFAFVEEPYQPAYAEALRSDSVDKAKRMSARVSKQVESLAVPTYNECVALIAGVTPTVPEAPRPTREIRHLAS